MAGNWARPNTSPTFREREIIRLYVLDLQQKEIAAKLLLSPHTIKAHLDRVYHRIGVSTQMQLVGWALREGVVTAEELRAISPRGNHNG